MNKQEEIRMWLKERLSEHGCPNAYLNNDADKILSYLHSQGVVIKVDREPIKGDYYGENAPQQMKLVEPLI